MLKDPFRLLHGAFVVLRVGTHGDAASNAERVAGNRAHDVLAAVQDLEKLHVGKRRDGSSLVHGSGQLRSVIDWSNE